MKRSLKKSEYVLSGLFMLTALMPLATSSEGLDFYVRPLAMLAMS